MESVPDEKKLPAEKKCANGESAAKLSKSVQRVYLLLALLLIIVLIVSGSLVVFGIGRHNEQAVQTGLASSLLGNVYVMIGASSAIIATTLVIFAVVTYSTVATDMYAARTLQCVTEIADRR